MNGYSVALPLRYDQSDGPYLMNKTLKDVVKQNFKMLLLTNKGERIMLPEYGIGIKRLLFDNREAIGSNIDSIIRVQVSKYMPFIFLNEIIVNDNLPNEENSIFITINYSIPSIKDTDSIALILGS